jgi:hypothetical protein
MKKLFEICFCKLFPKRYELQCNKDPINKDPIYVFPVMKLRGLVPNFNILVSVNDLYIPTIGPPIFCSQIGGPIVGIYKSLTET